MPARNKLLYHDPGRRDGRVTGQRRRFTSEQKAAILREHLIDRVAVSDLCEKHGIQPPMFDHLAGLFQDAGEKPGRGLEVEKCFEGCGHANGIERVPG
jgi:hypothetical protein